MHSRVLFTIIIVVTGLVYCQATTCYGVLNTEQLGNESAAIFDTSVYASSFKDLQGTQYVEFSYLFPQWNWATTFFSSLSPVFSNPMVVQIPWCASDIQVTGPCVSQWAFAPVFDQNDLQYHEFSGYTNTTLGAAAIFIDMSCYATVPDILQRVVNITYTLGLNRTADVSDRNYTYVFSSTGNPGNDSTAWTNEMCTDLGLECNTPKIIGNESIPFAASISTACFDTSRPAGQQDWVYILENGVNRPVMYEARTYYGNDPLDPSFWTLNYAGMLPPLFRIYFRSNNATVDYNITGQAGSYNAGGLVAPFLRSTLPFFNTTLPASNSSLACTCGINVQCGTDNTPLINTPIPIPDDNDWNFLPIPIVVWSPTKPRLNLLIGFNGQASYDPAGADAAGYNYSWTNPVFPVADSPAIIYNSTDLVTNITFMRSGIYVIRLAITDSVGTGSKDVTVEAINSRPIVKIQAKPKGNPLGALINITSIGTHDPDGLPLPLSYNWTSDGGPLIGVTNTTTNFTFLVTENSTICLQVFDGDKYSYLNASACAFIYINETPPEVPQAPLIPSPSFDPIGPGVYAPSVQAPQFPAFTQPPKVPWEPFSLAQNPSIVGPVPVQTPSEVAQSTWFFYFVIMAIGIAFVAGIAFKKFGKDRERKKTRTEPEVGEEESSVEMQGRSLLIVEEDDKDV